jgi:hypothetical protein
MSRTWPTTLEFDAARRVPPFGCCTRFFTGISKYSNLLDATLVPRTRLLELSKLSSRNCSPSVLCWSVLLEVGSPLLPLLLTRPCRASSREVSSLCKVPLLQLTATLVLAATKTSSPPRPTECPGLQLPWPRQWGARAMAKEYSQHTLRRSTPLNALQ